VQRFLRFIPSMAELNMLGKLWYHAEEVREDGRPRFDRIVVDAPSTGHGIGFLRVSQVVRDVVRAGPIAVEASNMARTFEDPARTRLHLVTLPEEMPTNETLEFIAEVRRTRVAPLGYVMVNAVMDERFDDAGKEALLAAGIASETDDDDELAGALRRVVRRRLTRDALTAAQLERLGAPEVGLPLITLPLLLGPHFGRDEMRVLASRIAEVA
jgi:anion-transporting  ArsA/GET3 family ATPase